MLIDFNIHGVSFFGAPLPFDSQLENRFSHLLPPCMANVAQVRKQEFIAGRYCAYQAAKLVGLELVKLPAAKTREPVWPEGMVGSITHSKLMAISCVSLSQDWSSIGIDAEELIAPALRADIESLVASPVELQYLGSLDSQIGSRFGCERSRVHFPEQPHASFGFDVGMTWHYQGITFGIANFLRPRGKHYL